MGKFYETTSTFHYSWDQLATAFWSRYPNPFSKHVLSEDTIERKLRGDELYSKRVLTKTNRMPRWGEIWKVGNVTIVEESIVNPVDRTITTYTRNVGYNRIMNVIEKVTYAPDPNNPNQTIAHRSAWIDSKMYGFRRAIERFGIDRFRKNCQKAMQGFNYVLNNIYPSKKASETVAFNPHSVLGGRLGRLTGAGAAEIMKKKARRAGERARAGSIPIVHAAATIRPGTTDNDNGNDENES